MEFHEGAPISLWELNLNVTYNFYRHSLATKQSQVRAAHFQTLSNQRSVPRQSVFQKINSANLYDKEHYLSTRPSVLINSKSSFGRAFP